MLNKSGIRELPPPCLQSGRRTGGGGVVGWLGLKGGIGASPLLRV